MRSWSDAIDPSTIPDSVIASENARRNAAKRTTFAGGRPPKPRCHCGAYTQDAAKKRGHACTPDPRARRHKCEQDAAEASNS
jgi:hypothetical protein